MSQPDRDLEEIIRIRDKRKGVFTVDNVVLNGYGKALGATGIAFYVTVCRYANRETQEAYPSLTTIQNETGMNRTTILDAAKRAEKLRLLKIEAVPKKHTVYTLLEPKKHHWSEIGLVKKNVNKLVRKNTNWSDLIPHWSDLHRERMKITNEDNGIGIEILRKRIGELSQRRAIV